MLESAAGTGSAAGTPVNNGVAADAAKIEVESWLLLKIPGDEAAKEAEAAAGGAGTSSLNCP